MQLFVLGMHRSGTSAVTRILNMAGAYFGPEGISNGADEGNPKGFWERLDVRAACDGLLHGGGFDWWRVSNFSLDAIPEDVQARNVAELKRIILELDAHRPWVVKEPRLSLLFPLVRPLLELPVCIHVVREPLEVAHSLQTRNGFPVPAGLALWELYSAHAFAASAGLPRVLVHYDELTREPVETVGRLLEELIDQGAHGLRLPSEKEITAFVSPDLHRERRSTGDRGVWLNERQSSLAADLASGRILDDSTPPAVSDGARGILRFFEEERDERRELGVTKDRLQAVTTEHAERLESSERAAADQLARAEGEKRELAERTRRLSEQTQQLSKERERRADLERKVENTLSAVADDLRSIGRSRTWRMTAKATSLLLRLRPGSTSRQRTPLQRALGRVHDRRLEINAAADDPPPPGGSELRIKSYGTARAPSSERAPSSSRPSVAVLTWDVGHNPLGRAHALAGILGRRFNAEIWGTQFERYGSELWEPLRDTDVPVHTFDGMPFPGHLAAMEQVARRIDADAIYVSKPRFPSYGLGILAKELRNRPLVLDVDDHELAFFDAGDSLDPRDVELLHGDPDLALPFGQAWTRAADHVIGAADALTVSNMALQKRFGGTVVPHARDERVFDPELYDRDETRRALGVGASDRLLLFGGTPRVHKGIIEVLSALERLGDERYRVALFGTRELNQLRRQMGDLERWVLPLPYRPFADLAPLVNAADLACVIQDPGHPVSRFQMPAKVTDALAMGVPCLVTDVPPLRPLIDQGVLHVVDGHVPLHERIAGVFDDSPDAAHRARLGRKVFLDEYSQEAVCAVVAPVFERFLADPPPLTPALKALVDAPRRLYGSATSPTAASSRLRVRRPGHRMRPVPQGASYDIVVFWKQNDTGIYGRRQDMFVKHLAQSGRIRSIVHFDNPTTPQHLVRLYRAAQDRSDQSRLVVRQTVARLLHRRDTGVISQRTFLHSGGSSRRLGLPPTRHYPAYVRSVLRRHGVGTGAHPVVFWVYPTNGHLPRLLDALDPDIVVADVVDDHRTFAAPGTDRHDGFERNYREVLARSDVVLANCEPVAEAMAPFAPEVHVVPNGCELRRSTAGAVRPRELRHLVGPIIGYVGNLSQRLDIPLLESVVPANPGWQFVFVGSAHHDRSVLELEREPNVHFLGVKPYEETQRLIDHFDVALIPHLVNDMTQSMNPLKAFVYCSAGVPIVSTPVANLDELADFITFAEGPVGFSAAIERALRAGRRAPDLERLRPHSWDVRVDQALDLIDRAVAKTSR